MEKVLFPYEFSYLSYKWFWNSPKSGFEFNARACAFSRLQIRNDRTYGLVVMKPFEGPNLQYIQVFFFQEFPTFCGITYKNIKRVKSPILLIGVIKRKKLSIAMFFFKYL